MSDTEVVSAEVFAAGLGTRQLHCRELGHNWRPWTCTYDRKGKVYDRALRCSNCHTERRQVLDLSGFIVSNRYVYPPNYLAAGKVKRGELHRDVFRLEAVQRFMQLAEAKAG